MTRTHSLRVNAGAKNRPPKPPTHRARSCRWACLPPLRQGRRPRKGPGRVVFWNVTGPGGIV
jgi:hypothetical protein